MSHCLAGSRSFMHAVSINSTKHRTIGMSPYKFVWGIDPPPLHSAQAHVPKGFTAAPANLVAPDSELKDVALGKTGAIGARANKELQEINCPQLVRMGESGSGANDAFVACLRAGNHPVPSDDSSLPIRSIKKPSEQLAAAQRLRGQLADSLSTKQLRAAGIDAKRLEEVQVELRGPKAMQLSQLPLVSVLLGTNIFTIVNTISGRDCTVQFRCMRAFDPDLKSIVLYARGKQMEAKADQSASMAESGDEAESEVN